MGRKIKQGLEYFPLDTNFFSDIKIRKLIKYQGGKAVTIYTLLLCNIYKEGYYIRQDNELAFVISEQTGFDESYILEVIKCCLSIGLFSKELYEKESVLTSKGIQERYQFVCFQARRKCGIKEYNLIPSEDKTISSEEISIIPDKTPENSGKSTQRKEKERKENPPISPYEESGGKFLSSSLSKRDGIPRNCDGLMDTMKVLRIPQNEQTQILSLSNYGEIGHPVWELIKTVRSSTGIKMPGKFIIKKLKEEKTPNIVTETQK